MDVAARFPLLCLPNDERIEVLRHMMPINLVKLSFLSKRANEMVISRKLEADSVQVVIDSKISIRPTYEYGIPFDNFYLAMEHEDDGPKKVKKPTHVYFSEYLNPEILTHEWKNDAFEIKDWLEHFHTIFHRKDTGIIFYSNESRFDFDSVYEHFKNPDELGMFGSGNDDYNNQIMKSLIPTKDIRVASAVFENAKVPAPILIQNFESFSVDESFTFNDLLCSNSKEVSIYNATFPQKDINRFFKLWISGSNRRLERLTIHRIDEEFTLDALVEGIKHVSLPDDHIKYQIPYHRRYERILRGGREIMRKDGTKGTVHIHDDDGGQIVELYIWHDHNSDDGYLY